MVNKLVKRAAIYARISKAEEGVDKIDNQVSEMKKLAAANNYEVVAVHIDDDVSAYKGEKYRSGYVGLIDGLQRKAYDVVLATELQRLTRGSPIELEALHVKCVAAEAVIHTRSAGIQDPATPTAKAMMQMMDVIGGLEIATKIERQKARTRSDLNSGIPTKGIRAFGWEIDRITVRESEAVHIRNAYEAILKRGESLWAVAQHWNELKLRTDGMSRERRSKADGVVRLPSSVWTSTTVRQILVRPRNAGILMHEGAEMPTSLIQPIVSREDFENLQSAIRGTPMPKGPKAQYLLGGILECICGERMHASKSNSGRKGKPKRSYKIYRCRLYGFDKSQAHVTIQLHIADAAVRDYVVENIGLRLDEFEIFDDVRLRELQVNMNELDTEEVAATELYLANAGSKKVLLGRLKAIEAEKQSITEEIEKLLSQTAHSAALAKFVERMDGLGKYATDQEFDDAFVDGFKAWDELPMETRRSIIRGRYRVWVEEGGRGYDRVQIEQK